MQHSINLSPEQPWLDASALPQLVDLYLADCATRLKPVTVSGYTFALSYLTRWWAEAGPTANSRITEHSMHQFAAWLCKQPGQAEEFLGYNSRDMIHTRVRTLFRWANHPTHNYIDRDFSPFVPEAAGEPPIRTTTEIERLAKLFRAAADSTKPTRNKAILAVLLGTGLRRGELVRLNIEDVQMHANGAGRLMIRKTKTGNPRIAVFGERTGHYLAAHLDAENRSEGALFFGYPRRRLSEQGVYRCVKDAIAAAGLADVVQGPHDLRRAFVTAWMRGRRSASNAQVLALQVGHSDLRQTLQYSLQSVEDIEETYISPMELMG
jgi:site-specific recombinase XerD